MLTNQEKIDFLLSKLLNLNLVIEESENNPNIEGKPSKEYYLTRYQAEKAVVLQKLEELGYQA
jgi:hypothetical protein